MRRFAAAVAMAMTFGAGAAGALELTGAVAQGGLAMGQAPAGAAVVLDGTAVSVDAATGTFVVGFGRDATAATLEIVGSDGAREVHDLVLAPRDYDIERIDGLPARKVTPNDADLARIRREGAWIHEARARDGGELWFADGFAWPLTGRISGRYGNQRILNGEPRRPHLGVDIAAPTGTPVAASAAGRVSLAEGDLFYTGGTVILDHGHGVTSIYSHLADVSVAVGDVVAQGDVVGTVGSTGRSTGPHLDWRINWFQTRLDPSLIAGPMPNP